MTAAFTDTALKLLLCPPFLSNPLQQGCPKGSEKGIPLFFPELLFWVLLYLLMFFPMLPVATSPAHNALKMSASKFQIITSVQCESETIFVSCLKSQIATRKADTKVYMQVL